MLVLTRKVTQKINIGDDVVLTVCRIQGNQVRIGIEAPAEIKIKRNELESQDADATGGNLVAV